MLTQTMPALVKALDGVLPPQALKQLTQALGNCNQPLSSRSDINLQPPAVQTDRGLIYGDRWDPNSPDYRYLIPDSGPNPFTVDVPDWNGPGSWNVNNYGGNNFNFSTPQYFNASNYYGGPTFNVGGNSFFDTVNTTNINVSVINGEPVPPNGQVAGPAGPAGPPGANGEDAVLPDLLAFIRANALPIRHLPLPLNNILLNVRAKDRLPTVAFGTVTPNGVPTVALPNYTVPAQALDDSTERTVEIDIHTYQITGDITLGTDTTTLSIDADVTIPDEATGTITLSEEETATLPVTGTVPIPTEATGTVTLSEEETATLPVTGTVPIPTTADGTITLATDTSESPTMEWTLTLPKFVFDPETCTLSVSESETYEATVSLPKWVVSAMSLTLGTPTEHNLTDVTVPKLKADPVTLALGTPTEHNLTDVTVPKLKADPVTLSLGGSQTVEVSGTVPRMKVESYTLSVSHAGTEPLEISIPEYSLPDLTATPDQDPANVDLTPVEFVFTGVPTAQRYITDIVVDALPTPVTRVFAP